jgi:hypothetical protein
VDGRGLAQQHKCVSEGGEGCGLEAGKDGVVIRLGVWMVWACGRGRDGESMRQRKDGVSGRRGEDGVGIRQGGDGVGLRQAVEGVGMRRGGTLWA